jgi:hypothetical protein
MRFKEIKSWYIEPEPYLLWLCVLIAFGILGLAWSFLSPSYEIFLKLTQENHRLLEEAVKSDDSSFDSKPEIFKFLLTTDQTSDFLQAFSTWIEKHQISVEQLTSANGVEGLNFELRAAGNVMQVFDLLNKFNDIPLLIDQVKLKITWPKIGSTSKLVQLEFRGVIHRSKQGKFSWDFQPYFWGSLSSCQASWRYQGWLNLSYSEKKSKSLTNSWLYRESPCGHQWVKMG